MSPATPDREQADSLFVILPNVNIWNLDNPGASQKFLRAASRQLHARARAKVSLAGLCPGLQAALVDEVAPHDTALVRMSEAQRVKLLQAEPGLSVVPVAEARPLWLNRFRMARTLAAPPRARQTLEVRVTDAASGRPLAGVDVVALTDRARRVGVIGQTNARGVARLALPAAETRLELVEAFPPAGHWPAYMLAVDPAAGRIDLACTPVDPALPDVRGALGLQGADDDGAGVKVAVIDTGVARHRDLRITLGRNVVKGERATAWGDEIGHDTHVAGIIAGHGQPGRGSCCRMGTT
jgi:hypothetical protein